jgi:DNA-binding LacI/PurR family transcriptional regulator
MTITLKKDLIYNQLRENILSGKMTGKLPTELNLARILGVGKVTLRSALDRLQAESLISKIHGRGTFVVPKAERYDSKKTMLIVGYDSFRWHSPDNYIIPEVYQYVTQKDYNPEIINASRIEELSDQEFQDYITQRKVVGIFYLGSNMNGNEPILARLRSVDLPVIMPHARYKDNAATGFCTMYTDYSMVVDSIIDYLSTKGHKKIAFIGLKGSRKPFRKNSLQDIILTLQKRGCITPDEYFPMASYGTDVEEKVKELISLSTPPTTIIFFSDFFAVNAYRAIKNADLRIPEDVSVIGICGYPDVDMVTPHLSTVDFQYSQIARQSVNMLINNREWYIPGKTGPLVRSDFKLIERKSVLNLKDIEQNREAPSQELEAVLV